MRVHTRFRLTSLLVVMAVSAAILGGGRWWRQAEAIHELNHQAERAIAGAYRLELFGLEYLYKRSERARQQWLVTHERLGRIVGVGLARDPATEQIRARMEQDLTRLRAVFSQLATRDAEPGRMGVVQPGPESFSQRLSGQLATSTATFVENVQRLQGHYANTRDHFRHRTLVGGITAIGAFIVLIVWLQGIVTRRLVGKIARLNTAVQGFPGQTFSIPVANSGRDELDELGGTFQEMAVSVTASQRSLAEEIEKEKAMEQQLSLVIEGAALGYWDWDYPSGRLVVNDRWLDMLGLDRGDFHSCLSDWSDRLHSKDRKHLVPLIERHIKRGEPYAVEFQMRHKNGHWVWIQGSGATVEFDPDTGQPLRVCGTHQDISDRKLAEDRLRKSEQLYRGFFEQAPQPYQSLDEDGTFLEANAAWRKTLGFEFGEIAGRRFSDLLAPGFREQFERNFPRFKAAGEVHNAQFQMLRKDGEVIDVVFDGKIARNEDGGFVRTHCLLTDVTEQRRTEARLQLFRQQIDQSRDAIFVIDSHTSAFLDVNEAASGMLGYSREELLSLGVTDVSGIADTPEKWEQVVAETRSSRTGLSLEDIHVRKDGSRIPVEVSAIFQDDGKHGIFVASARDITERKQAQDRLTHERAFLQTVIDSVGDPILVIGKDYGVMLANRAARAEGRVAAAGDGQLRCHQLSHGSDSVCDGQDHPCPLRQVLETRQPVRVVHNHVVDDRVRTFELLATPLHDEHGEIMGIIEASRDVTDHLLVQEELKAKDRVLHHLAHHDSLTGLPNRLLFTDRLNQALREAHRSLHGAALLFIDLDHFKEINDSLGHSVGDRLLQAVSERLRGAVREDDTVARPGGDEFTVIMGQLRHPDDAVVLAQKLIGCFRAPFQVEKHELHISSSIGLSLYPEDGEEAETLLRNADAAMYRAKAEGRNTFQFYTADMTAKAFERVLMEGELRKALSGRQLVLHYQAQVQIGTGQVIGAEALIRWLHPEQGMIPPGRFIPVAEQSGQIVEIGRWVLEVVCSRMVAWRRAGHPAVRVAVNLSAKQLTQGSIAELVRVCLEGSGCDAQYLELEITEGYLMHNPERAVADLEALRGMGVGLAVDDFGTGYSSLSYLKQLPITKLKIDQSFVRDITHDPNDQAISRAIIALGKSLGLDVIAEGVETDAQREFLQAEGCEEAQGYYFTRPLPEEEFLRFLAQHA